MVLLVSYLILKHGKSMTLALDQWLLDTHQRMSGNVWEYFWVSKWGQGSATS